ncbi:hypothetical protein RGU71_08330 [Bacillus thuringiensis]|uniref:hypothetical protein n=1 Tax=Bacillus thuringiensis TaxID=1428 RepID=UPI0028534E2D|nr:hypothetical protein [Bacillus thuringiensis]MDR4920754.1 hypothetical protein [Bacillus thuringiensis]MED3585065.1 hypothetical protein [Bacillus thuringiensis]HDR4858200.1 hypothetical protein [Bacillus cereus]
MGKKRRYLKKRNKEKQDRDLLGKKGEIVPFQYEIPKYFQDLIDSHKRSKQGNIIIWEVQRRAQEQFKTVQEMQKRFQEEFKPIKEMQKRIQEQYKPTQEMQKRMREQSKLIWEIQKRIQEQYKPLFELVDKYKYVNWNILNQSAEDELRQIEGILIKNEKEYWCLDMNVVQFIINGNVTEENLSKYVEDNLEAYVAEIIRNPMYEVHVSLIQEAYQAYKIGLYKLCIMPLFAAFEHVIAFWLKGHITTEMISIKSNPNVRRLYKKVKPEEYRELEIEQIKNVFVASVLRSFHKMFITGSDELGTNLNRNSISHGFHDYSTLSKVDVLKLFQLLKSTLILQFVSPKKVAE